MIALRAILWAMSIGVWVFSAGFDGAFLCTLMPDSPAGRVFAYCLNFVADVSNEMLAYVFMKLQQENRKGSKKRKWSYWLLLFEAGALYFGTIFSWATIQAKRPDMQPVLQWSAAIFAQATLLGLGVAQALLDVQVQVARKEPESDPQTQAIASPSYQCDKCGEVFDNRHRYSGHMRWCVADRDNGRHPRERVEEGV